MWDGFISAQYGHYIILAFLWQEHLLFEQISNASFVNKKGIYGMKTEL